MLRKIFGAATVVLRRCNFGRMTSTGLPVTYDDGFRGLLYHDDARPEPAPGILLIHGGGGIDEHARQQGLRWAALGYTVFVCDMFGDGVAGDRQRVIECLARLRDDPAELARRAQTGV